MQLFIILALLLYGGKSDVRNVLSEVKPMLESFGDEGMKQALKSAEEISEVISAVQGLTSAMPPATPFSPATPPAPERSEQPAIAFPLAPVADIADREITYSLSRYISQN